MITERDITVWIISALLAVGIGWSRYAKWRTRDKIVRELAAMDPDRREKMLSRMKKYAKILFSVLTAMICVTAFAADQPACKKSGKNCPMNDGKECNCGKSCNC